MTMRDAARDTHAPDLYLLQLAQEATDPNARRSASAVLRASRGLGLVSDELALAIDRIIHGRSRGSDEAVLNPPSQPTAPQLVAVLPIDREVVVAEVGTVWLVDLEIWRGEARLEARLPPDGDDGTPPLSGFERASLLPGRFRDLVITDDAGSPYQLAYTPGRGMAITPSLGPGAHWLQLRSRAASFPDVDLELAAATPVSIRPSTPADDLRHSAESHLLAVAEEALHAAVLVAGFDRAEEGVQAALGKVRTVANALYEVGAVDDEWCADEVENAVRDREPSNPQWRRFVHQCGQGRTGKRRVVPVPTDVGEIDGVHATLRSLEVSGNRTQLYAALARTDNAPEVGAGAADPAWFSSWAQTLWRAEDDLGNLYLGAWGRSWPFTGEFSVCLRPALAEEATSLTLLRRGKSWTQTVLKL